MDEQYLQQAIVPVILAGGSGERLWPLSKRDYPKQFVSGLGAPGKSLFQQSIDRVSDRVYFAPPLVVCNDLHRFLVQDQLQEIDCKDATIIVEPLARNTAPAAALAALHVEATQAGRIIFIMPSDHLILQEDAFLNAALRGAEAASAQWLVTFAITPTAPETGYGYIRRGEVLAEYPTLHHMEEFVEKPDLVCAQVYLADSSYGWNSGMFLMRAAHFLEELATHAPLMHDTCAQAYATHRRDGNFLRPEEAHLQCCPADSLDYAVMEHTARGAVLPVAMGWSDLGAWTALDALAEKDECNNAVRGPTVLADSEGCYIHTDQSLVAAIGLRDVVVVAADNAVLIGPKTRMQEIKTLLRKMHEQQRADTGLTGFSHRPWGRFHTVDTGGQYKVKRLHVRPGEKISLQSHMHRSEHWVVVEGRATVITNGELIQLEANQSTYIPAGTVHRLENREAVELVVIEVQTGHYLGEDDIRRYEDSYNRLPKANA